VTLALTGSGRAQSDVAAYPDSPAGARLEALIAGLNTDDQSVWEDFVANQWQPAPDSVDDAAARRLDFFRFLREDLGGVEPIKIDVADDTVVTATLKALNPAGTNEYIKLIMWISSEPPHLVQRVGADTRVDPGLIGPAGALTQEEVFQHLDEYVDDLVARDRFSGTIAIAKDGEVIYRRVAGVADKRWGIPNKLDTKFNLGSMNKMFTGVAISQLVEAGDLTFQTTVGEVLPDYPNADVREKVTIHHLLTHTAGLGDYWDELFDTSFWEIRTVNGYASLFATKPLEFEPGERFQYSNAGPIVLGLIIEKLSGQDYYSYIRDHVTGPAGMSNTECYEIDRPVPNLAIGYTHMDVDGRMNPEIWRSNLFLHAVKGGPAGGGFSTVEDLLAFARALQNGTLLSPAYVDTLITGKVQAFEDEKYAYLFGDRTYNGHRIVGHGGGAPGINAQLDIYIDDGYTVAVMSNYSGPASAVAERIAVLLAR
jgi:CubicO group peptidase (beta-lactamase class C family)